MEKQQNSNVEDGARLARQADTIRLAGIIKGVGRFKTNVKLTIMAGAFNKIEHAENALISAAELLTDLVFITHQYAGRAEQLESRIFALEAKGKQDGR